MTRLILISLLLVCRIQISVSRQLLQVNALWRHGDRSPVQIYHNDIYNVSSWPQGMGQLTKEGMLEELRLGQNFSSRYLGTLLRNPYFQHQIYIRSTDVNRTLISAEGMLAGLYQGRSGISIPSDPKWPAPWLPIPVHTVQQSTDYILSWPSCPAYNHYQTNVVQKSSNYTYYVNKYKTFFEMLTQKAGQHIDFGNVWIIADDTFIEQLHNRTEPGWLTAEVWHKLDILRRRSAEFMYWDTHQARLRGGPQLKEIIQRFQTFIQCRFSSDARHCGWLQNLRFYGYSAHDITVLRLLRTLGRADAVKGGGLPSYAASVALELWAEDDGSYSVQTLYKDGWKSPKFVPITVSGCPIGVPCPLSTFIARSQPFLPTNITTECANGVPATPSPPPSCDDSVAAGLNVGVIILSITTAILGSAVLYLSVKVWKQEHNKKEAEPFEISKESIGLPMPINSD